MPNIKVLISEDYLDRLPEVAQKLQAAGMHVEQWLPEIGVVTGSTPLEHVSVFTQIEGVDAIELDEPYQIAPPNSDTQ